MTESVEFVAKSRFSFKTLFVVLALLVVFEIIQQHYFQGSLAGKNTGNVLLVGISISYFFYRYNLLKIIITPQQVSFGSRKNAMQSIDREHSRIESANADNPRFINIVTPDEVTHKIPLGGFSKQQKVDILKLLEG